MRIVLLNQFFWPDPVATAQLLSDAADGLSREHEVTVISSAPPSEAFSENASMDREKIRMIRIRGWKFSHRRLSRIASYVAYLSGTAWKGIMVKRPDLIVSLTTPPLLPAVGAAIAALRGCRHVIWEMDVYPDIATDIGFFKAGGILDRVIGAVLDWSRHRADSIIVLGEEMKLRLLRRGVAEGKLHVAENWADGGEIQPTASPDGPLVVEYSGNLGLAHEIETIAAAIERLESSASIRFVFAGGGPKRPQFEAECRAKDLRTVEFKPYCSRQELGQRLGESHIGLVTQLSRTSGSIVPSKIYGIMAAGRPLLYIGPEGTTPATHIAQFKCGWHILPGDVDGLVRLLCHLNSNRNLIYDAGVQARAAFEQQFDRAIGVERIRRIVERTNCSERLIPELTQSAIGD